MMCEWTATVIDAEDAVLGYVAFMLQDPELDTVRVSQNTSSMLVVYSVQHLSLINFEWAIITYSGPNRLDLDVR